MNSFLKEIRDKILVYDGSKGTMLHKFGMKGGECPELWNVTRSSEVKKVYSSYKEAGANVIQTNTFQGNRLKLEEYGLGDKTYELNIEAVRLAREVMGKDGFVAASIGPLGKLFEPSGDLTFEAAYETFKEQVRAVVDGGADIINFETFTDLAEMRAALIAAKEVCDLPVICSIAFEANGRTLMGTNPYVAAVVLKALGADMIGTNCSLGPEQLLDIIKKMSEVGGIHLSVKPNAGLPELVNGETVFKESPEKFAALTKEFVKYGVRLIGGCCGTTPEFIKAIKSEIDRVEIPKVPGKTEQVITSQVKLLNIERLEKIRAGQINADLDKEFLEEVKKGNMDYVVDKAIDLSCEGFDAIYVKIDKIGQWPEFVNGVINTAQSYIKEPFIVESNIPEVLEDILRVYKGKAGIVLNHCSSEKMEKLLLVAKKYGSTVIDGSMIEM
ncbi:MAG: homocysteine S-methyltransferase family protein [Clostridia bacterium]|nr:homocysteine S-methyltransferase family protein [Clostridia bacterium]